jgi:hypothetical protein
VGLDVRNIRVGLDVTDQILIKFFCIRQILEKNESTMRQYISF